ncbi:MAG: hypothetical protein KKD92_14060 [Proteobacteria bacterium]|nr:hypothetical protein [Pseudomonadota bacterium]
MDKILNGVDKIMEYTRKSAVELMDLKRDFGFPMIKKDGVFYISISALVKWLKSWGIQDPLKIVYADVEKLWIRREEAKETGKMLSGDVAAICEKLRISPATFLSLLKNEDFPARKVPGTNQYEVNSKKWRDYYEKISR